MDNDSASKNPEPSSRQGRVWLQSTGRATVKKADSIHVISIAIPDANTATQEPPTPIVQTTSHPSMTTGDPGPSADDHHRQKVVHERVDRDERASRSAAATGDDRSAAQRIHRARSTSFHRIQSLQSVDVDSLDELLGQKLQGESIEGIPDAHSEDLADGSAKNVGRVAVPQSVDQPQSDLDEETDDWLPKKDQDANRRTTNPDHILNQLRPSDALDGLVGRLGNLAEKRPGCIVLLCGCHEGDRSADTAALTAITAADRLKKSICLIDGDLNNRSLSRAGGDDQELGVANAMATQSKFDDIVWGTSRERLDWIPAGNVRRSGWHRFDENLNQLIAECQERYDLICVYLPTGIDELAKLWAGQADSSYLVVSMQHTSQVVAEAAVENLRRQGARLAGCIVTDAPVDLVPASAN